MSLLTLLVASMSTASAVPVQLIQQGRLLDHAGVAVNGIHVMTFRLYDDQTAGNMVWDEGIQILFNNGYYSAVLGDSSSNPLDDSVLSDGPLFMEVEVDGNGPIGLRQPVVSSPYSRIAGTSENLSGGTVDAAEISVGGQLVIDATGSWVGPALAVNWSDVLGVPADIADGDADTLAGISCQTSQILAWDGVAWGCAEDNGLTEAQVEAFVTNDPLNLALGSMVAGDDIVTTATDQDSLSDLSCQNGDVAKYDSLLGWQCGLDLDTTDWAALQNIPADLADGDDVLSDSDVDAFVENDALDLAVGTTVGGTPIMGAVQCQPGEILSYDGTAWNCASFQSLLDVDGDGVLAWDDCDDTNSAIGSNSTDFDCDGFDASIDCNDMDPSSESTLTDGDCDGVLTADDCDDSSASYGSVADDGDCDGVLTADDCDDTDPASTTIATDADCDGVLTADDCDDLDPNLQAGGGSSACAAVDCKDIMDSGYSTGDGLYWIDPTGNLPFQAYCDMTTSGGGWTLVAALANRYAKTSASQPFFTTSLMQETGAWTTNVNNATPLQLTSRGVLKVDHWPAPSEIRYVMKQISTGDIKNEVLFNDSSSISHLQQYTTERDQRLGSATGYSTPFNQQLVFYYASDWEHRWYYSGGIMGRSRDYAINAWQFGLSVNMPDNIDGYNGVNDDEGRAEYNLGVGGMVGDNSDVTGYWSGGCTSNCNEGSWSSNISAGDAVTMVWHR